MGYFSPKRLIACVMSTSLVLTTCASTVLATTNNQLNDAAKQLAPTATVADLNEIYSLTPNQSCADLEKQLEEYIDRIPYYPVRHRGGVMYDMVNDSAPMAKTATASASPESSYAGASNLSDFSQTNIQVSGVDEGDILKTTKTHLYYYNQKKQQIDIIALDPTKKGVLDVTTVKVAGSIAIPEIFANNVNLYVRNNQLVITSQWYPQRRNTTKRDTVSVKDLFDDNSLTLVITYDITNPAKAQLTKLTALPGSYNDARLIDNELVLITDIHLNTYRFREAKATKKIQTTPLLEGLGDALPREVSFVRKPAVKGDYEMINDRVNCADLSLSLPDSETIEQFGYDATFSLISRVNLDAPSAPAVKHGIIGRNNQLHMARDYLYLTDQVWMNNRRTCPADAACFFAGYDQGAYTVVHKLDHNAGTRAAIRYVDSTVIPGGTLTQYSMMQNADGNFQIITQGNRRGKNNKTKGTHVHILDQQMNIIGSLMGIEPDEDFKSSRFIGDKLYLVTFEQIDPLFVVDLINPRKPTIIGELKIPGYSTYLHPHSPLNDGVQYILGLGYDTQTTKHGGVVNAGIKVDLYKIDYTKRTGDMISVKQIGTKTLGGQGSASDATHNPRVFVRNAAKQELTLPLFLSKGYPDYSEKKQTDPAYFAGYKVFFVDTNGEINEKLSRNFIDQLRQGIKDNNKRNGYNTGLSSRNWNNIGPRVGYIGDTSYVMTNDFAEWFDRRATVSKMLTFATKPETKKETK